MEVGRNASDVVRVLKMAFRRRRRLRRASAAPGHGLALGALAAVALAGCGQAATGTSVQTGSTSAPSVGTSATATSSTPTRRLRTSPHARPTGVPPARHHNPPTHGQAGLPYSTASAQTVQRQPAPGSCHAIGSGLYSRPDPHCTPGALNPAATQANIDQTICRSGWTDTVRPAESVTETEKAASMAAYGDSGSMGDYEYDHFVPLELGGAVNDPRNLWPEPGASPNPKDAVEDELNAKVCDGQMTLAQAQNAIAANWIALAQPTLANPPTHSAPHCSLSASYSDRYHDYDVYVHSNQPDQTVTVTDTAGRSATWHTDASGYADVYFRASEDAAGETVTARVGGATCQGTL